MGSPTKPGALGGTLDLLLCPKMAVQRVIVGGPAGITQVSGGSSLPGQRAQGLAALILKAVGLTAHGLTLLVPPTRRVHSAFLRGVLAPHWHMPQGFPRTERGPVGRVGAAVPVKRTLGWRGTPAPHPRVCELWGRHPWHL